MFNIFVEDKSFLSYADFKGKLSNLYPTEVWCEEIEEEKRPPKRFKDSSTYVCKDGWLKLEGSDEWSNVGLIRIVY